MNIKADWRGIGIIVLVAAATMAIVTRVPAIRDVIFPDAVRPVVARRARREDKGIWIDPNTGRKYRSHPFLAVMKPVRPVTRSRLN